MTDTGLPPDQPGEARPNYGARPVPTPTAPAILLDHNTISETESITLHADFTDLGALDTGANSIPTESFGLTTPVVDMIDGKANDG